MQRRTEPGGCLVAEGLKVAGVETFFTLAGGHIMPILDACVPLDLRIIDTRHEGAAALAAEGWALATGEPGCAVATAGPGFTNALTGLFDAGAGNAPLVLLGGRSGMGMAGQGTVGDLDQRSIAAPGVKWSASCPQASRIPRYVAEAFYRARAGRPGAVYLEVPQDLLASVVDVEEGVDGFPHPVPKAAVPGVDVEKAVNILAGAERPLVLAGGGAFWSRASQPLANFCEQSQIPVVTTSSARGLIPDNHPCCLGSLVHGGVALLAADVVLVLGSAFNANLGYGRPPLFSAEQTVIQVDITAEGLGGNRRPHLGLVGDVSLALAEFTAAYPAGSQVEREARERWLSTALSWVDDSHQMWDTQIERHHGHGLHAGVVAREIAEFARQATSGACTLVADGGDALAWALGYFFAEQPGRMLSTTTALGTLGVGLPFALAARAARPEEPVLALVGDGSFGLAAMEVDTMVRHQLPVVVVVSNNHGWGDVRHEHQELRDYAGPRVAAELSASRYDRLAEALGARGEHVTRLDDLRPALDRATQSGRPTVINVETDPTVEADLLKVVAEMNLM
jgi:thiamine pyrophosphate-dependent acetolactate synthase large subunit-like protein